MRVLRAPAGGSRGNFTVSWAQDRRKWWPRAVVCLAIVTDMSPHPAPAPTVDPGPAQNVISNTDTAARYLAPAPPRTTDNRQLILYIFQIYYLRKQHLAGDRDVFTLVIENIDDPMTGLTSGGAVSSGL